VAQHLLDVNALIALGWNAHKHHETMLTWFNQHARHGWATCAFTQAGFVRVLSQPTVAGATSSIDGLADALERNLAHPAHRMLTLDLCFSEVLQVCTGGVVGHRQVTDAYLLSAAIRADMKLLTFDSGITQLLATDAERQRHVRVLG
jgi:uncharacterized protein